MTRHTKLLEQHSKNIDLKKKNKLCLVPEKKLRFMATVQLVTK